MNLRTEAIAGITTFFTMAYIVVVNPTILSTPGTGMAFSGVLTATVLICFVMTLLMGVTQTSVRRRARHGHQRLLHVHDHSHAESLVAGCTRDRLLGGRAVSMISVTPIRETIAKAIPSELRIGTAAGIGIFPDVHRSQKRRPSSLRIQSRSSNSERSANNTDGDLGIAVTVFLMIRRSSLSRISPGSSSSLPCAGRGTVTPPPTFFSTPDFHTVFLKSTFSAR
jgi:hypothetical protein